MFPNHRPYNRTKSPDELEADSWGEPDYDSQLFKTVHRLRTKPVGEFTVEDLRIMIGQEISLVHLVPLAIEVLEREPLAAGALIPDRTRRVNGKTVIRPRTLKNGGAPP